MAEAGGRDGAAPRVDLIVRDFDLSTLVALRHEVQRQGERSGLSGIPLYRFLVAVNEITTNAVRHGGGTGHIELWRSGPLLCCRVTDRGAGITAGRDHERRPPPETVTGRGLWLARQGCETFAIRTGATGTTVTLKVATVAA